VSTPTLKEARAQAEQAYHWAQWTQYCEDESFDRPDTLDKVEAVAWALLQLLANEPDNINRQRLLGELDRSKLDETWRCLDAVRLAARRAHVKRRRGRPKTKADLRAAYSVLVKYWQRTTGEEPTNGWDDEGPRLEPTSPAAIFLFDELRRIDPGRERLAEQLQDIMIKTVKDSPGPRRGRPRRRRKDELE
jgi:hypothetical protein